uniref:Uncharacterized protein n=1 Tax=Anguilla anguilla TaxID=7936 RepID=A0A0E9WCR8_ANGAN
MNIQPYLAIPVNTATDSKADQSTSRTRMVHYFKKMKPLKATCDEIQYK